MPVISRFHGVLIKLYPFDAERHHKPHIHAEYGEESAVYDIEDGTLLAGSLSRSKERLVLAWIELHREELHVDWNLAVRGLQPFRIEPLR